MIEACAFLTLGCVMVMANHQLLNLLMASTTPIFLADLCDKDQLHCANDPSMCIPDSWVCDGDG